MAEYIQIALPNQPPRTSGRGVRFDLLAPTERDQALLSAATLAGTDKTRLQLLRQREGVKRMLRAVTKKRGLTDEQVLALPESEWMKVTQQGLEEEYDELFTTKDDEILAWFYRHYHEPTEEEVQAIAGKARMVCTD